MISGAKKTISDNDASGELRTFDLIKKLDIFSIASEMDLDKMVLLSLLIGSLITLLIFTLSFLITLIVLPKIFELCAPVTIRSVLKNLSLCNFKIKFFIKKYSALDPVIIQTFIIKF